MQRLELTVELAFGCNSVFHSGATLTQLRRLRLNGCFFPSVEAVPQLSTLSELIELNLQVSFFYGGSRPGDDGLRALVSGLPHLRVLKLKFDWRLSGSAIVLVGQLCPLLVHLELNADCDIQAFEHTDTFAPTFPLLKTLMTRDAGGSGTERWVVSIV